MRVYRVWSVDNVGDEYGGYSMNDRSKTSYTIELSDIFIDRDVIIALVDAGYLNKKALKARLTVEGDDPDYELYVVQPDGFMLAQLVPEKLGENPLDDISYKRTFNQFMRSNGWKVTSKGNVSIYETPYSISKENWFYAFRKKIPFNNMLMTASKNQGIMFNIYWDQLYSTY